MKISEIKMDILESVIPELFRENGIRVQSTMYSIMHPEEPRQYDINLSGWSCQTPETIRIYAEALNEAANLCESLNNLELTIDPETKNSKNIVSTEWRDLRNEAKAHLIFNVLEDLKKYLMEK